MTTFTKKIRGLIGALLLVAGPAFAQSFSIDTFTIAGGSGTVSGGAYSISGSVGQPDGNLELSGGDFSLSGGFWGIIDGAARPAVALGENLILNPGAEDGPGSVSDNDILPVPNWTTTNNFTVIVYDSSLPPAGPEFGTNFFAGGPTTRPDALNPFSSASQLIDLSALTPEIDAGSVMAELSGYFGGYGGQDDRASLTASYFDAMGHSLGGLSIGNVLAVDRTNHTALLFRGGTNAVPAGTRQIQVVLNMTNDAGAYYNDGYADNLSLVLRTNAPSTAIFDITAFEKVGNELRLTFTTVAGENYSVQSSTNLSSGMWTTVPGAPTPGTGGAVQVTLTGALDQPQQFYRVKHLP